MPRPTFHNLPADKRRRIVDAAIEEFGSRPYAQATLDRIVEAAGVSKGSMYQYFEGKADLYRWLITVHTAEKKMAALGSAVPSPDETLWEMLERLFASGVTFALAEPALTRLGARFHRDHHLEPELTAIATETRRMAHDYLTEAVTVARDRGELRADIEPRVFASLLQHALGEGMLDLIAAHLGVALDAFLDDPALLRRLGEADVHDLVDQVLRLYRGGAAAPTDGEPL